MPIEVSNEDRDYPVLKLFRAWNTSSEWWVVAPNEEIAIDYSFSYTSTREKRNIYVRSLNVFKLRQSLKLKKYHTTAICFCMGIINLLIYLFYEFENSSAKTF